MYTFSQKPKQSTVLAGIISVLLLLFLISFISSPILLHLVGLSKINGTIFFISRMLYWVLLVWIWFYSLKIEKQNLLTLKERKYKFSAYLVSIVVLYLIIITGGLVIIKLLSLTGFNNKSDKLAEILNILRRNKFMLILTPLTAGVTEELIFRGYMLPRLSIIFKSPSVAIIISSVLFGLLHYKYCTILNIVIPVFIGLVFACYYWKYRNIKIIILCHFLWDLILLLLPVKGH